LNPKEPEGLPIYVVQASVLALDDSFWDHAGFEWGRLLSDVFLSMAGSTGARHDLTLTEKLAEEALLPIGDQELPDFQRRIRISILANALTERYSRDQILSWYLNSADYGRGAHGIDAASLVYFEKPADQLSLAEAALIAGLPKHPARNPIDDLDYARERQLVTLNQMREAEAITRQEWRSAQRQPLLLSYAIPGQAFLESDFEEYLWRRTQEILGPASHRSGLKIVSTLDADLQEQATCAAGSHVARMSGEGPGSVLPAGDGSSCIAAGLLPPVRPGDSGIDHNIGEWSMIVLDPRSGEILSALGNFQEQRKMGTALYPFVYLTAFSRGYAPASMILDLPLVQEESTLEQQLKFHGPVSMRTALTNILDAAGQRVLRIAGLENVLRIGRQMGLMGIDRSQLEAELNQAGEEATSDLLEIALASGVIANQGKLVGVHTELDQRDEDQVAIEPMVIREIQDLTGDQLYQAEPASQPVLSAPLAYLLVDVLSDPLARKLERNGIDLLDVGRPVGMILGLTDDDLDNWAVGFSPQRVVAVRLNAENQPGLIGIGEENGAAAIWYAVQRYSERAFPAAGWERPIGVNEVEVCTPSGLLPTVYCPETVREVFIYGTEPSSYDTLYQPYRVNRETGKLATLFTPVDLIEEKIYLIPPEEAAAWAALQGLERPPLEYDTIAEIGQDHPEVNIGLPTSFKILNGLVEIEGTANIPSLKYFRLQYGEGLNPTRWVQLGSDRSRAVSQGNLGSWDTQELNGLFTLQLLVVNDDGQVFTSSIPVTIDNKSPQVRLVLPEDGAVFSLGETELILLEARVDDEHSIREVQFFIDGERVSTSRSQPFAYRWRVPLSEGLVEIYAKGIDEAGNASESDLVTIRIER
jgi:membrane carboxypeptidase/penicillin-binding protein